MKTKDYAHRYQKLGGFLLFLVIMTFLAAFTSVTKLLFERDGFLHAWRGYEGGEFWLQLVIQICAVYAIVMQVTYALMIIRRDPRFVRTWQLIYIGTFAGTLALLAAHLIYGYPQEDASTYNSAFAIGLVSDIFAFLAIPIGLGLLTLYISKSVRVRTYMGSDKYLRLAFFTRKARGPEPAVPDGEE